MDAKFVEQLKEKHGSRLHVLSAAGVEIIVKAPSRAQYKNFRAKMQDEMRRNDAPEQLLRECVVHPEISKFDEILEQQPALVESFGSELLEIAGLTRNVEKKAL